MTLRLTTPRVPPLPIDEIDPEIRERIAGGPGDGAVLNIFRTLAQHPKLLKRWLVFGSHVLGRSSLGAREREILILRIGWLCGAEYEFAQHVLIGRRAGLADADIQRIVDGPDSAGWDPFEAALVRAADELHRDAIVSDQTWKMLSARYGTEQLMDAVFTVGQYNMVSMALNTLGVQLDAGLEGFARWRR
jgi:4-carboxymuconolactone decarboxylase